MNIAAKSPEEIEVAFGDLGWRNHLAGALLGAFAGLVPSVLLAISGVNGATYLLVVLVAGGAGIGLHLVRRWWRSSIRRYSNSFMKLDERFLEIRGVVPDGVWHVRFHLDEVASIQLGECSLGGLLNPLVAAIDSSALTIRMKNGKSVRFQMIALIYRSDELVDLLSRLELRLTSV